MTDTAVTDTLRQLPPPERRGRLDIGDDVVKSIATKAAATVSAPQHASGLSRIITGDLPHVGDVTVRNGLIEASLTVAAPWPTPVTALADRVRTVVAEHLTHYTGLSVTRIDVDVRCVATEFTPSRRVL